MKKLAISQGTVCEVRVDKYFICAIPKSFKLPMRHAESPTLLIVGRAVRDQVGLIGKRMNVPLELRQRHLPMNGHAVAHDVEVGVLEIDDPFAPGVLDVCIPNIPLARNGPIENL